MSLTGSPRIDGTSSSGRIGESVRLSVASSGALNKVICPCKARAAASNWAEVLRTAHNPHGFTQTLVASLKSHSLLFETLIGLVDKFDELMEFLKQVDCYPPVN